MRRLILLASFALAVTPGRAFAQAPIRYEISFDNRAHHEARVRVTFPEIDPGPLEVRMSRTSPGRYALHEFAKNVYDVRAQGRAGRAVRVERPDPHQWTVTDHGGDVTIEYTLYADWADGTYSGIDRTHGHLNMPATFMWARGLEARPIELSVRVPEGSGWQVATQLSPTQDPFRFTARNLAYFLDSPTEVSAHWTDSWTVDDGRGPQTVRISLHHAGTDEEAARYGQAVRAIVRAAEGIYGAYPRYDHGTYTFLADYLPWVDGDGMEHRNSTVVANTGSLADSWIGILSTVAHEYFHSWSIERIRPASLEPFDFEEANMSRELWFGEGFTSYFDDLILWRAGLVTDEDFAARMGGIANTVTLAPGRRFFSPVEMSMQAPFVDAAVSVDPNNRENVFLSYYTWGSGIALGLDLTLRSRFPGVTLDHLMRDMWRTHGEPEVPYTVDDIEAALGRVTGDVGFAADFFDRYVRGQDAPPYAELLRSAGISFEPRRAGAAWLGPLFVQARGGLTITTTPWIGTPLYDAGLDRGDRIVSIDGRAVSTPAELDAVATEGRVGDRHTVRYESRGSVRDGTLTLQVDPRRVGRLLPLAERSNAQNDLLQHWKEATP